MLRADTGSFARRYRDVVADNIGALLTYRYPSNLAGSALDALAGVLYLQAG